MFSLNYTLIHFMLLFSVTSINGNSSIYFGSEACLPGLSSVCWE